MKDSDDEASMRTEEEDDGRLFLVRRRRRGRSNKKPKGGEVLILAIVILHLAGSLAQGQEQDEEGGLGKLCRRDADCLKGTRLRCKQVSR